MPGNPGSKCEKLYELLVITFIRKYVRGENMIRIANASKHAHSDPLLLGLSLTKPRFESAPLRAVFFWKKAGSLPLKHPPIREVPI